MLFSILTCAALTGCGSKDKGVNSQHEWKLFSSKTGNFSALFPGAPRETVVPEPTAAGEIKMHSFIIETDAQTAYGINYNDYPDAIDISNPQKVFDRCQVAMTTGQGKIITQTAIKFGNYPARELEFQPGGLANYSGRVRLILVGRRIYSVSTVFLTANPHPAEAAKFLDSFSLNQK